MRTRSLYVLIAVLLAALLGSMFMTTASEHASHQTVANISNHAHATPSVQAPAPGPSSSTSTEQSAAPENAAPALNAGLCEQIESEFAVEGFRGVADLLRKNVSFSLTPDDIRLISELHTPESPAFRNELLGMPAEYLDRLADNGDLQAAIRHVYASNVMEMNNDDLRRTYKKSSARLLRFAQEGHQEALYALHFLQMMVLATQDDETTGQLPSTADDFLVDHAALSGFLRTHGDIMFYVHERIREEAETVPAWLRFRSLKAELQLRALTTPPAHLQENVAKRLAELHTNLALNIRPRHGLEDKERAYQLMKGEFGKWQHAVRNQCATVK